MADVTIGELPALNAMEASTLIPVEHDGTAKSMSGTVLENYVYGLVEDDVDEIAAIVAVGPKGDDGVSPTVTTSKEGGTATVTITDVNGAHSFTVEDGDVSMEELTQGSASGNIASFTRLTNGLPVNSLEVAITPKQAGSGDPSPTNIRTISGWTGANVYRAGKNLCVTPIVGKTYNITTGAYSDSSTTAASDKVKIDFSGGYITLSHHANIRCMIFAWDKNGTFIGRTTGKVPTGTNTVFTVAPTDFSSGSGSQEYTAIAYVAVRFYESSGESDPIATAMAAAYPQLEAGSTATAYEPYTGTTKSISFGQTVYGGTLNVTTGLLTVTHGYTALSSLSWSKNSSYALFQANLSDVKQYDSGSTPDMYCSAYTIGISGSNANMYTNNPDKSITLRSNASVLIVKDSTYSDAATFASAMGTTQLVYPLATSETYQLTAAQIASLLGTNNIWADTGPVYVQFDEDIKRYIQDTAGIFVNGIVKGDGTGNVSAAVAGTDYIAPAEKNAASGIATLNQYSKVLATQATARQIDISSDTTLNANHNGCRLRCANGVTITVPSTLSAGYEVEIWNYGNSGSVTISPATGVTLSGNSTDAILTSKYDVAVLAAFTATDWAIKGDI